MESMKKKGEVKKRGKKKTLNNSSPDIKYETCLLCKSQKKTQNNNTTSREKKEKKGTKKTPTIGGGEVRMGGQNFLGFYFLPGGRVRGVALFLNY